MYVFLLLGFLEKFRQNCTLNCSNCIYVMGIIAHEKLSSMVLSAEDKCLTSSDHRLESAGLNALEELVLMCALF